MCLQYAGNWKMDKDWRCHSLQKMTAVFVVIMWLSLTYQDLDESVNHFLISFSKKNYNKPIAINAIIKKERENVKIILK